MATTDPTRPRWTASTWLTFVLAAWACSSPSNPPPPGGAEADTDAAQTSEIVDNETAGGPGDGAALDAGADAGAGAEATGQVEDGTEQDAGKGKDGAGKDAAAKDTAPSAPVYTYVAAKCGDPPPTGQVLPTPAMPKKYAGTCPKFIADGKTSNVIQSSGNDRSFKLLVPPNIQPGEKLPVLFAWYWLKASANSFVEQGELVTATTEQRFIAVVPESKNDIVIQIPFVKNSFSFPWPIVTLSPQSRFDEEYAFFDDMLSCVAEQYPIDNGCVSVAGVSAGALFGAQLAGSRSEYFSSFISLSGGVQSSGIVNSFVPPWPPPAHKLPTLVLWGGPSDSCVLLNFQDASKALETNLDQNGQFVVECEHNCQHGVPPIEPLPGESKFAILWKFAWSHPYWLPVGASPWAKGLPAGSPDWCAVGTGNAKIRSGACDAPGCPM